MHENRIIHRDIKGQNILVSKEGVLKFADFGLARDLMPDRVFIDKDGKEYRRRVPYTSKVVTPFYRSPENCLKESRYDEKIDVWSTGCVFAEIIAK